MIFIVLFQRIGYGHRATGFDAFEHADVNRGELVVGVTIGSLPRNVVVTLPQDCFARPCGIDGQCHLRHIPAGGVEFQCAARGLASQRVASGFQFRAIQDDFRNRLAQEVSTVDGQVAYGQRSNLVKACTREYPFFAYDSTAGAIHNERARADRNRVAAVFYALRITQDNAVFAVGQTFGYGVFDAFVCLYIGGIASLSVNHYVIHQIEVRSIKTCGSSGRHDAFGSSGCCRRVGVQRVYSQQTFAVAGHSVGCGSGNHSDIVSTGFKQGTELKSGHYFLAIYVPGNGGVFARCHTGRQLICLVAVQRRYRRQ